MSEFLPIQIRHLDKTIDPLIESNLLPVVVGNEITGFETRATELKNIFNYVNIENQNSSINSLNVSTSAVVQDFLNIGDVFSDTGNKLYVDGNVFISGSLSALSGVTFFSTNIAQTSSLFLSGASGVSLKVNQYFDYPIAQFFDGENISLHIDGNYAYAGNVGIKTTIPNEALTVFGNISSSSNIYSDYLFNNISYSNLVSAKQLSIEDSINLGTNNSSTLNFGNSTSNINFVGNLNLNTNVSAANTIIGNENSDIFVNGMLITKNISSSGNIFFNTNENEIYTTNIGNISSINNFIGTNVLSGISHIKGDVYLNPDEIGNTYINTNQNEGAIYLGNPANSTQVNSKLFTINSVLTSNFLYKDFTEFESLTTTLDDVFATSTVVLSSLIIDSINPSLTSFQYRILETVNAQTLNLETKIATYGSNQFITNLNGSIINLNSNSNMILNCVSGGSIDIGNATNLTNLNGSILQINNNNDGILKNTYINNQEDSGSLYLGNIGGETILNGETVYINADEPPLVPNDTYIGNLSSVTFIHNLNIIGGLSAGVSGFNISNINSNEIITDNLIINQNSIFSGNSTFTSHIDISSVRITPDVVTATTPITGTNSFLRIIVNGENKYIRLYEI
jgi:hypothetical protein